MVSNATLPPALASSEILDSIAAHFYEVAIFMAALELQSVDVGWVACPGSRPGKAESRLIPEIYWTRLKPNIFKFQFIHRINRVNNTASVGFRAYALNSSRINSLCPQPNLRKRQIYLLQIRL